ncbi:MAG: TIGR00269 family protein [Desulfurococcaceae archaeon]
MAKCSSCNKPAIYINKVSGLAYCRQHFIEHFERKVRKAIRKYKMIGESEHIIVAVSGGKDSMALLHFFQKFKSKLPKLEITAVLVDEGIAGYREKTIPNLISYASRHGVRYIIASFKNYIGKTLDEIVKESFEKGLPYMPCSYCGVFRRHVLNAVAREVSATVIATAHNMDDVVQTYLMNLVNNSWERIIALTPVRCSNDELIVKRIKPFYELPEKETALYAILNNLVQLEFAQCPYVKYNMRFVIRRMINELEDKYPGSKHGLLKNLLELFTMQCWSKLPEKEYLKCTICGNPSSHAVCKACMFKMKLGLLQPELEKKVYEAAKVDSSIAKSLQST